MKRKLYLATFVAPALLLSSVAVANEDMTVQTWTGDCAQTMTTNHFELAPGESVSIEIDLSGCSAAELGKMLYFGYKTTKNSSKHLRSRDGVKLTLRDDTGGQYMESVGGSLFTDIAGPTKCVLTAQNTDRRKSVTVRLRSSIITEQ